MLSASHEVNQAFIMSGSAAEPSQRSEVEKSMLAPLRSQLFNEDNQPQNEDSDLRQRDSLSKLAVHGGSEPPAMVSAVKLPRSPKNNFVEPNSSFMRFEK